MDLHRDVEGLEAVRSGSERGLPDGYPSTRRSVRVGALASAGMVLLYAGVVGGLSGSLGHLAEQVSADWYLLLPIVAGFGVQVGLLSELRRRHRMHVGVATAGTAGAGASTLGMVACCAHHAADLAPFVGATAAATFLYRYRLAFMLVGIGVNAIGIAVVARRLRHVPRTTDREGEEACEIG